MATIRIACSAEQVSGVCCLQYDGQAKRGRFAEFKRAAVSLPVLACLAMLYAQMPASAQDFDFDRFILIQPIQVCDGAGNCAAIEYYHAGTAKALGQAGVLPLFLPLNQIDNPALFASNTGPGAFEAAGDPGGSGDDSIIDMWFTGFESIVQCGPPPSAAVGCAHTPGKRIVIDSQALINEATGNGDHPYHRTIAHEIGHNFDLDHVSGAGFVGNLLEVPATVQRSGYYDQIGDDRLVLTQDQIDTIRNDVPNLLRTAVDFNGGAGPDAVTVAAGEAFQNIFGGGGDDTITLLAGSGVLADVQGGAGNDEINVLNGSIVGGNVDGGADDDTLNIGGIVLRNVQGGSGDDIINVLTTGHIVRGVDGGSGDDTIRIEGTVAADPLPAIPAVGLPPVAFVPSPSHVTGGTGSDTILLLADANVAGSVFGDNNNADESGHGDDIITMTGGQVAGDIHGEGGNDIITIVDGVVRQFDDGASIQGGNIFGGSGNDLITVNGGRIAGNIDGGADNDEIVINGGLVQGQVLGGTGNDTIRMTGGDVNTGIRGGSGNDIIAISGGRVAGGVFGDDGNDMIQLSGTGLVIGNISGGADNDTIGIFGGTVSGSVLGGLDDDAITMTGGSVNLDVNGEDGDDTIRILGGSVGSHVLGGSGADFIEVSGIATIAGIVDGGTGDDEIRILGGAIGGGVFGGAGADTILLAGGTVGGNVSGGADADTIVLSGTAVAGTLFGGGGDDLIEVSGGSAAGVSGETGNDIIRILGGAIGGNVSGGAGADAILLQAGTVGGDVDGGADADTIVLSGTAVTGTLFGGDGADLIEVSGGSAAGVSGGAGDDSIRILGGAIGGNVSGGTGADAILLAAGTVGGDVDGGAGADILVLSGTAVTGTLLGGAGNDLIEISGGSAGAISGGIGDDTATWTGGSIANFIHMGDGSDTLDIFGVNAGGTALQAGLAVIDGGDDASSADGQIDTLNLRGVVEVLTNLQNWEFINLIDNSRGDLGPLTRSIVAEQFFIGPGSTMIASSAVGAQVYTIGGNLLNAGAIDMIGNAPRYDELAVTGTYTGQNAVMGMDAFLGGPGSPSDLLRVGSATAGQTNLVVNDTNPGAGAYNPLGVEIVRVESPAGGNTAPDHFVLVGGPIDKGLWIYDLGLDATRSNPGRAMADVHVIYSRPTGAVQFTPFFGTAALEIFHASLEPWTDRQRALADKLESNSVSVPLAYAYAGDRAAAPSETFVDLWAAPFGTRRLENATSTLGFFGNSFSARMDYSQNIWGVQGGLDVASTIDGSSVWTAGVFGGYLSSSVSPEAVSVKGDYEGGSVGAYASYLKNGLSLSAVFKANFLKFDWRAPVLGFNADADVNTFGGRVEVAYKQLLSHVSWVEPYASLTYARSFWDSFSVLGTEFSISNNESLLGRTGLRIGADMRHGQSVTTRAFAGVGLAYEFKDTNTADIVSGAALPLVHVVDSTNLELQGGLEIKDPTTGLSASLSGYGRFSKNTETYGGRVVINYRF